MSSPPAHKKRKVEKDEEGYQMQQRSSSSAVPSPSAFPLTRVSIYKNEGGANIYCVIPPKKWLSSFARVEKSLMLQPRVRSIKDARVIAPKAAWFHHTSRFGLTKRLIMTLEKKGGNGYAFSGQRTPGVDWTFIDGFSDLVSLLDNEWGESFTMCHANLYLEDAKAKMAELSKHSDDEGDLDRGKPIVCISLGNWPMRVQLFSKEVD